jgi:glutathione peroxidase
MRTLILGLAAASLALTSMNLPADPVQSLYELKVTTLDGKPAGLAQYKGHVVLVVNTASHCGNTPQYAGLEKLYTDYKDKGFVILGFPSNDFGGQEPGTAEEISTFCTTKYNVTFPMFEKVKVKVGDGQAPVYQFLTTGFPAPDWNFSKYLVDGNGKVIQEFKAKLKPDDKTLVDAIEAALAATPASTPVATGNTH